MTDKLILIVEDNPDQLELTVLTLADYGSKATIVTATDGAEALDYLFGEGAHAGRNTRQQPAFVLLDIKLPKLSGLDVLRRLRADPRTALVPVVMLSSSSEQSDLLDSYQAGANGFVRKPVDFNALTQKLVAIKTFWLDVNEALPPA